MTPEQMDAVASDHDADTARRLLALVRNGWHIARHRDGWYAQHPDTSSPRGPFGTIESAIAAAERQRCCGELLRDLRCAAATPTTCVRAESLTEPEPVRTDPDADIARRLEQFGKRHRLTTTRIWPNGIIDICTLGGEVHVAGHSIAEAIAAAERVEKEARRD